MNFNYYYNHVPGESPSRNNLIYTSLISDDKKVFVQWYHNDTEYHKGQNQVVDPLLMEIKWEREVKYLKLIHGAFPDHVPKILDIDYKLRKIYLQVDGPDFWQCSLDGTGNFDDVLPDWREQMLEIIDSHHLLNLYKYSMHPSSYFIVDGKLRSINYFFTYHLDEGPISISDHLSHIYSTRQEQLKLYTDKLSIDWNTPQPLHVLEHLCWDSFRTNYPEDFIDEVKQCIR